MRTLFAIAVGGLLWAAALSLAVPLPRPKREILCLDLQPLANQKLKESLHGAPPGNDLSDLPQGEQKFCGVKFKVGAGLIQLASKNYRAKPHKIEGIRVGRHFAKLYILHAVGNGYETPENTVVAKYVIHYEDKVKRTVDIVFGQDVRDWWYYANSQGVSRAQVAWTGTNTHAKGSHAKIRLYLTTWKNPRPKKKVTRIDFLSTATTLAAPFCVAITLEGE